ncbi:MAG: CPBP family intramembrane metalloprotease [Acidobacteriota bacterium]|nr:CPBP family intramembrane metalloprotease [Acidobacteriota bacterium]
MSESQGQTAEASRVPMNLTGQRAWAVVGLIVVFGWNYVLTGRSHDLANIHDDLLTIAAEWAVVIILAIITFGFQKRNTRDLGLRMFGWRDLLVMVGVLVGSYLVTGIVTRFVTMPAWATPDAMRRLVSVPFSVKLGLVLTAAICEEFMYRGFAIEELGGLTGSLWLAGAISWLGFSLAHMGLYGFAPALLVPAALGAFLTLLYLWRRNLPVCMLMHAILDGFSLLILPALLAGHMK